MLKEIKPVKKIVEEIIAEYSEAKKEFYESPSNSPEGGELAHTI